MFTPLEAVCSRRAMRASRDTAAALPTRKALEARHDLSCAALAHTEELLDRRAVEVSACHGTQGGEDFVKSMKPGGLGGHGGISCFYYMLGSDPALWHFRRAAGEGSCYHA